MRAVDSAVIHAAIRWSVTHSPIVGPHDTSPAAEQMREQQRIDSEQGLHDALSALYAANEFLAGDMGEATHG